MKIKAIFKNGVPPGMVVKLDGQTYRFVGMVPHETKAGDIIFLSEWATECATCAEPMTIRHMAELTFSFTRRCEKHRQRGVRVTANELEASR